VTEDRANWRKTNEIQKTGERLTDSWQRDLAELMSVSEVTIYFFKTAAFNQLGHSSVRNCTLQLNLVGLSHLSSVSCQEFFSY